MRASGGIVGAALVLVALAVGLALLLLGGDPKPDAAPAPASSPPPAPPRPDGPPVTPLRPPTSAPDAPRAQPAPPQPAPAPGRPAPRPGPAQGDALVARAKDVVRRGEGATAPEVELAAAADLEQLQADVLALGVDGALVESRRLLARDLPRGVQEVGARLLGLLGTQPALETLADVARDAKAEAEVRLQALRGLRASPLPFARGAVADVAQDRAVDGGVRGFALHLLRDAEGASAVLVDVTLDADDEPRVRAAALEALFELEPARARTVLAEVGQDPKLAPIIEELGIGGR